MKKKRFPLSADLTATIVAGSNASTLTNDDRRHQVLIGRFPGDVCRALNIPDLDVVTSVAVIEKIMIKHGLTSQVVAGLHGMICRPLAVYNSASKGDSIVIVSMTVIGGDPLIASIVTDTPDAAKKSNMHWLTSAYPKENRHKLVEWEANGLLLWRP